MKLKHIPSSERGLANHGWLKSFHSFSFASFYDENKMGFGQLRVLNEDSVSPAMGFNTHSHQNMEIVTIPLTGQLKHQDNLGNTTIITTGEVQIMSAGTGISHSEFNNSEKEPVHFLQIWIKPNQLGLKPRYDQISYELQPNIFRQIVGPISKNKNQNQLIAKVNQEVYFSLAKLEASKEATYKLLSSQTASTQEFGVYVFVINGQVEIANQILKPQDAAEIEEFDEITLKALTDSKILIIETPLNSN